MDLTSIRRCYDPPGFTMHKPNALLVTFIAACVACTHPAPRLAPAPEPAPPPVAEVTPPPVEPPVVEATPPVPAPVVPADDTLRVTAVGDMMLGSDYSAGWGKLPPDDGASLFAEAKPVLALGDVVFGNVEGALLDGGESHKCTAKEIKKKKCWAFRTPTRYGHLFKEAGFNLVSLANNHVVDFGPDGMESTMRVFDELGIAYSGKVGKTGVIEVRGRKVELIAFASSATYLTPTYTNLETVRKLVSEAKARSAIVIVSMHAGKEGADYQHLEWKTGVDKGIYAFAHAAIDAGADLVLGHSPHVLRGMEIYKDRLIAYSLGNFATYGTFNLTGPCGLTVVLDVTLAADGKFVTGKLHAFTQTWPGGPRADAEQKGVDKIRTLSAADFGETAIKVAEDGTISPP